jgi:hypothetical protein
MLDFWFFCLSHIISGQPVGGTIRCLLVMAQNFPLLSEYTFGFSLKTQYAESDDRRRA